MIPMETFLERSKWLRSRGSHVDDFVVSRDQFRFELEVRPGQ